MKKAPQKITARGSAFRILGEVLEGKAFASERLDVLLNARGLSDPDRALCTQLVYGVLREKGFLDRVLGEYVVPAKTPKAQARLLLLAVYQGLFLEKIPDYALVDESVELAKSQFGMPASRMVNAVLRRFLSDREKWRAELPSRFPSVFPPWLVRRWQERYPAERLSRMMEYYQALPPIGLRVHPGRADPDQVLRRCRDAGLEGVRLGSEPFLLLQRYDRNLLRTLMEEGKVSMQDPHSFQVAQAVQALPGEKLLDACAGHGGKSAAIAERRGAMGGHWVHEPQAGRLQELRKNFERLDLPKPEALLSPEAASKSGLAFDWILVDAPCSGLGTLGRKPEIRWRLRESDLAKHSQSQAKILREWWPRLKPGGHLVYAVCSLEPEEGENVVQDLVREFPALELLQSRELSPADDPGDGFFLANLRRKA